MINLSSLNYLYSTILNLIFFVFHTEKFKNKSHFIDFNITLAVQYCTTKMIKFWISNEVRRLRNTCNFETQFKIFSCQHKREFLKKNISIHGTKILRVLGRYAKNMCDDDWILFRRTLNLIAIFDHAI